MAWMIFAYAVSGGLAFFIFCKDLHLRGFDVSRGDAVSLAVVSLLGPMALAISLICFATSWVARKIEFHPGIPFWRKSK